MAIKLKSPRRAKLRPKAGKGPVLDPAYTIDPELYAEWVVQQSENAVERADYGIAALDGERMLGPGGLPPVPLGPGGLPPDPLGPGGLPPGGGGFRAADRAMREATAAVHRSDLIVEKETARAFKFVDDAFARLN